MLHFVKDPCLQTLEHMEVPCGNYHPLVHLHCKDCRRECGNCKQVHMRSSSVDAVCRHLIASSFHVSHASVQMSHNWDSEGRAKRYSCTAGPWHYPHCVHRAGSVSQGALYPSHRSVPHSHGPQISGLTAHRGGHDVQCALGTSFWGRDLTIHLRAGDGITWLFKRISAGDVLPGPRQGCIVMVARVAQSANSLPVLS